MSGVLAVLDSSTGHLADDVAARMIAVLAAHGPDEQAFWRGNGAFLAHTSLVTTREQATERQPVSLDHQIWLSADVRLDGRNALIAELRRNRREVPANCSDDVLVLHAYHVWGIDCLDHITGDFAFAVWDGSERRLFCATDQMGVCPLYYADTSDGLVVSTALNAVRVHPRVSDELNEQAIADYLLARMNHESGSTTFRGMSKLPSGHRLVADQSGLSVDRYWTLPAPDYVRRPKQEYVEQFSELFESAVSDRLRSDRAGTHLSGGMGFNIHSSRARSASQQRRGIAN